MEFKKFDTYFLIKKYVSKTYPMIEELFGPEGLDVIVRREVMAADFQISQIDGLVKAAQDQKNQSPHDITSRIASNKNGPIVLSPLANTDSYTDMEIKVLAKKQGRDVRKLYEVLRYRKKVQVCPFTGLIKKMVVAVLQKI